MEERKKICHEGKKEALKGPPLLEGEPIGKGLCAGSKKGGGQTSSKAYAPKKKSQLKKGGGLIRKKQGKSASIIIQTNRPVGGRREGKPRWAGLREKKSDRGPEGKRSPLKMNSRRATRITQKEKKKRTRAA